MSQGKLWSPGYFSAVLMKARDVTLVASTEEWIPMLALSPQQAYEASVDAVAGFWKLLTLPPGRGSRRNSCSPPINSLLLPPTASPTPPAPSRRARNRTVIAGYHWFTDWGRDTMISLEGLTLARAGTPRLAISCVPSPTTSATD